MHVIFMAPNFPANQRQFVRALSQAGAYVTGIGDVSGHHLDPELKGWLSGYEHVRSLADEEAVFQAVRRIQKRGPWVHRLEATIEGMMLTAAHVRERAAIPGLSVETVTLCRDKFEMKQFLRKRGIPCARNAAVDTAEKAQAFVEEVGYPVILKPRDGAGAHSTYRLNNEEDLKKALAETGLTHTPRFFTMEEFVSGHEGFYDTLTCNGKVIFEGISHYYPNVLEGMRERWISPQIVITNRMQASGYQELRTMGRKVLSEMGLGDTSTHMEWFFGPKGLSFSEIGARPPGCRHWDLYNYANDCDLYLAWAQSIVHGESDIKPSRHYAAGIISIRPSQDGKVCGYDGLNKIQQRYGEWILHAKIPPVGSNTVPIEAGYLANGWLWVRHPDYDQCRAMLDDIGRTLKIYAR
ncbi:MAG TPA: ATPase [Myxococcales bacterium]|nr:ATPase [Deltaproteobacteria bacterium]MBU47973.1 ATPase [Deltaproteobacteria bacterium]HAA59226.1 ATPase [Myxococcales bacterium]|tara:strand:- start:4998 stop:6224 length:1227 start_codon:yes stop_codon:yes gene_type:complete